MRQRQQMRGFLEFSARLLTPDRWDALSRETARRLSQCGTPEDVTLVLERARYEAMASAKPVSWAVH